MDELDPKYKRLIYIFVLTTLFTFIFMRGCMLSVEDQVRTYGIFHHKNFIKLCEDQYDELAFEAQRQCDDYFKSIQRF